MIDVIALLTGVGIVAVSFLKVFAHGLQTRNVTGLHYRSAFIVSWLMTAGDFAIFSAIAIHGWSAFFPTAVGGSYADSKDTVGMGLIDRADLAREVHNIVRSHYPLAHTAGGPLAAVIGSILNGTPLNTQTDDMRPVMETLQRLNVVTYAHVLWRLCPPTTSNPENEPCN